MSKTVLRNFFAAATVAGLSLVLVQVSPAASAAAASAPTAPSNLTVTPADFNNIRLNWKDNSNNESGFEINNGVVSKGAPANSTAFTWGGLAPGTYMCLHVRAYNSAGSSAWEPIAAPGYRCTTTPLIPPSNLTVTPIDSNNIRLNWKDNSNNESGFEINNGIVSTGAPANSTTFTWGGLAPGTYMCFHIRAYGSGNSAWEPGGSPAYQCTTTLMSNARIDKAIAWAKSVIGSHAWDGFCETFVELAYGASYRYANAQAAFTDLHTSTNRNPDLGALVWFVPNSGNGGFGHVGIYIGNDQFISATNNGVATYTISYWDRNIAAYEGWGPAPASWPGRI